MNVSTPTAIATGTGAAATLAAAREKTTATPADFETFLTLLTAQLRNQDPLKPIDSTAFVAQLASFSAVEQQVRTNDTLGRIETFLSGGSSEALAVWLGLDVASDHAAKFDGTPIDVVTARADGADRADLVVRNASGAEVQRLAIPAGDDVFHWPGVTKDGTLFPAGTYRFEIESFQGTTKIASDPAMVFGRVVEARLDGGKPVLVLDDGAHIEIKDVRSVRDGTP